MLYGRSCGSGRLQPERPVVAGVGNRGEGGTGGATAPPAPPLGTALICAVHALERGTKTIERWQIDVFGAHNLEVNAVYMYMIGNAASGAIIPLCACAAAGYKISPLNGSRTE